MSETKRNVPKLRFPEFTEDWEQRKLSDFTERVVRKNGEESDRPLTISAQDGLVDQREYFNRQVASKDMSNYYLIKNGEFAYNKSYSEGYPFGAVKRLDYYESGALSTLYIVFKLIDTNVLSDFIVVYYMTHLWYGEISKRASEGARNHGLLNISPVDFFQSEMLIPTDVNEQRLIGKFFENFDNLITLHQRKLENLKLKKKALLQKLFPKNGEQFPELRFPGFTDAWEQRKLSDFTERVVRKNGEESDRPLTISAQDGLVDQREYFNRQVASKDMSNYYLIKNGEFAYNKSYSEGYPFGAVKRLDYYESGALSTLYIVFKLIDTNVLSDFIVVYYMTHLWYGEISKRASEGARNHGLLNISPVDFFQSEMLIPTDVNEQRLIGKFFENFDNLITLHQRKLEHLQLQKKALLQQMFV